MVPNAMALDAALLGSAWLDGVSQAGIIWQATHEGQNSSSVYLGLVGRLGVDLILSQ